MLLFTAREKKYLKNAQIISKITERQEKHMINRYEVYETNQMIAEEIWMYVRSLSESACWIA